MKLTLIFQILAIVVSQMFSDNMVLQQGREVPVWGTAAASETVSVTLTDEGGSVIAKAKTKADKQGSWSVNLPAMKADGKSLTLEIKGKKESLSFSNVAVGEVWLCSGQSNMAYEMLRSWQAAPRRGEDQTAVELARPANNMIRVLTPTRGGGPRPQGAPQGQQPGGQRPQGGQPGGPMPQGGGQPGQPGGPQGGPMPQGQAGPRPQGGAPQGMPQMMTEQGGWKVADGESLKKITAVGYFFAKNLSEKLGVPVGIISSSSGGSEIEQWIPGGNLYTSGIQALMPYAIGGFLWYQGESNLAHETTDYIEKFQTLTSDWRSGFNSPDAPFYCVLLAPHTYSDRLHRGHFVTSEALPLFWQTQLKASEIVGNSECICITDLIDTPEDIHPSYKWIVGERLANLAIKEHFKIEGAAEWSGPKASGLRIDGNKAIVTFDHVGEGLKGKSNSVEPNSTPRLKWFEVAGEDGIWHQAFAEIVSPNEVAVTHPEVAKPAAVRFAWRETAQPNLYNSLMLPAYPFILK